MNTPRRLDCREAARLIFGALDRPLSEAEQAQLEAHVARCEGCTNARDQAELMRRAGERWRAYRRAG